MGKLVFKIYIFFIFFFYTLIICTGDVFSFIRSIKFSDGFSVEDPQKNFDHSKVD